MILGLDALVCPKCRTGLETSLACGGCGRTWPIREGLPVLFDDSEIRGNDRLLNTIYDRFAALHDPAVKLTMPLFGTGRESTMRQRYIDRLELDALADQEVVRILEIGIGTGANVARLHAALPKGPKLELWGVDLALGMVRRCQTRLAREGHEDTRLVLADAHALPFADDYFDRVFHVGATNNYSDPKLALSEMARVARPNTPIVVVDERLAPDERHSLYHRAMFRLVTFYDWSPQPPVSLVPAGAANIRDEQIARFFYCLTFSVP